MTQGLEHLSARQRAVLAYLIAFLAEKGYPPTNKEVADNFGWRSINSAVNHLHGLQRKGWIDITPNVARGLRIIKAEDKA